MCLSAKLKIVIIDGVKLGAVEGCKNRGMRLIILITIGV